MTMLRRLAHEEGGQMIAEHAVLIGMISLVVVVVLFVMGSGFRTVFDDLQSHLLPSLAR